jgi:hypothetical protein
MSHRKYSSDLDPCRVKEMLCGIHIYLLTISKNGGFLVIDEDYHIDIQAHGKHLHLIRNNNAFVHFL